MNHKTQNNQSSQPVITTSHLNQSYYTQSSQSVTTTSHINQSSQSVIH